MSGTMDAEQSELLKNFEIGIQDHMLILFVRGEATHVQAATVREAIVSYLDRAVKGEFSIRQVAFHLGETPYMDSTFMGILLLIDKVCMDRVGAHLQIINPSAFCRNLLETSGVGNYLPIETSIVIQEGDRWGLHALEVNRLEKARLLLSAHEELSNLSEENRKQFALIKRLLVQDIESLSDPS